MIPITNTLRKMKFNHLYFVNDLKVFGKNEEQIISLVASVNVMSSYIGMEFGIKNCAMLILKRGNLSSTNGIELPDGLRIREVEEDGYKYHGVLEQGSVKEKEMRDLVCKEYFRRVKLIMKSRSNGQNMIMAMNACVGSVYDKIWSRDD